MLCIYFLYVVDVVNDIVFELSFIFGKDKERFGFMNLVLVFFVVYKFGVRSIIVLYLYKYMSLEK